jgi:hypothetical protein
VIKILKTQVSARIPTVLFSGFFAKISRCAAVASIEFLQDPPGITLLAEQPIAPNHALTKSFASFNIMKNSAKSAAVLWMFWALSSLSGAASPALETGFASPPAQTQPWCYWYWISDNISKDGITKDLEAMKEVGIGEALIGNIFLDDQPAGRIKVLTEEWWLLIEHAIREGGRLGVNIGMFNCPGWSQSGGPWITAEKTMRRVASSEIRVTGPKKFSEKLQIPNEPFQDIAVLAFPAPQNDGEKLMDKSPRVTCSPEIPEVKNLVDGNFDTAVSFPVTANAGKTSFVVDIELDAPLTARSLSIFPTAEAFGADAELQVADEAGNFQTIHKFKCDRSNPAIGTGFMPRGPVTVSFPATKGRHFRIDFSGFFGRGPNPKQALAEIELSGAARLESFVEKQLAKMHSTPLPLPGTYTWPTPTEPESPNLVVPVNEVRDLSSSMAKDGTLTWDVPPGDWVIQRIGKTPTGMRNDPASPEGKGYEVDKMNRKFAQEHFDAFVGQLLKRMPASDRKAFTRVVADSYEMGSQNWTDDLAESFKKEYGYDPQPWLPVLSGRILGSAVQSERFLWDLRRLVADRVATDYVGGMNGASKEHGLGLWLENYGHWGFPGEFLKYGGQADRIGGEFWVTGDLGSIECRAASSCANTYGKPFVSAESFTGGPSFQNSPSALKARGDWSFCEGVNHVVLHVYIQQPSDDKIPGINAWFGTEFNRHNTWFKQGKAWVDYERRSCWMLQQGWRVADVAYFIGEDVPKMTGARDPVLPPGYDYDHINAEVIQKNLSVENGQLVLPHGVKYKVLVLPKQDTMRPEALLKIRDLVKAGATILGPPPVKSPSLENQPQADAKLRALVAEIWGDADTKNPGERQCGKGRIIWGKDLSEVLASTQTPPDIEFRDAPKDAKLLFTHRSSKDAQIYFISNQKDRTEQANCAFRVTGLQPELWDAVTGERRNLPEWSEQSGQTVVPLSFAPRQSWSIVFRQPGKPGAAAAKNFPETKPVMTLSGTWQVAFDPKWGGPEKAEFTELTDWTTRPEEGIKYYSGSATYQLEFELAEIPVGQCMLDLGKVHDLATVRLNGKDLGTIWTAPWTVDISKAIKTGANTLEITVTNPWNNRLVGDRKLPVEKRLTSTSFEAVSATTPLLPAGLLGPVSILSIAAKP